MAAQRLRLRPRIPTCFRGLRSDSHTSCLTQGLRNGVALLLRPRVGECCLKPCVWAPDIHYLALIRNEGFLSEEPQKMTGVCASVPSAERESTT